MQMFQDFVYLSLLFSNYCVLINSLDNVYLVSVEVGERTDEGAQVCLWDWAQDFTLLQRCLIYDTGEQHIFPTKGENPFGVYDDFGKHPWESDKAGLGKASGKTDHRRRRRRRLKKQLKLYKYFIVVVVVSEFI